MTTPEEFKDFSVAAAGASAALIGLLFVAVSVNPERGRRAETRIEYQTRATTALVVFTNALVLSLAFLVPDTTIGGWAVGAGTVMAVFTLAGARVVVTEVRRKTAGWGALTLVAGLAAIVGFELFAGIRLLLDSGDVGALSLLDYVVIAEFAVGIARAWQLVNMHDTGLVSSLLLLTRGVRDEEDRVES